LSFLEVQYGWNINNSRPLLVQTEPNSSEDIVDYTEFSLDGWLVLRVFRQRAVHIVPIGVKINLRNSVASSPQAKYTE
jgi:hypothetical protein